MSLRTSSQFSLHTCVKLAQVSQAAYSKAAEIEKMSRASGADDFHFIDCESSGTQCFIEWRGDEVTIAFRGTENIQDWITDAKFRRVPFREKTADAPASKCQVHRGFLGAFASVKKQILAVLEPKWFEAEIFVTGHSLGGALAILCARYLQRKSFWVKSVYTFGQPRVGNASFAHAYDFNLRDKTFRVVNEEDIVPRLPFWSPHFCGTKFQSGYRHCGTEIFLDAFGDMQIDLPFWRKIPSDIYGLAMAMDIVTPFTSTGSVPIKKHFMASYIERLSLA
jgi:triacylglycerol lipase